MIPHEARGSQRLEEILEKVEYSADTMCVILSSKKRKEYHKTERYTAENLLNRNFSSDVFGEKILTGIAEFSYGMQKKHP